MRSGKPKIPNTCQHPLAVYTFAEFELSFLQGARVMQPLSCSVPFYIAAPTTTLDAKLLHGDLIKIEERDPRELTHHQGIHVAAPGINVRNFQQHSNKRAWQRTADTITSYGFMPRNRC